ncbi:MAG: phosphonate C-P lyase system protein PhnH [Spirochaetia bacterium]
MAREIGFDEVFDSQATFRALLDSMSRPGKICQVPLRPYRSPPNGFCSPALTILKTLCDHRVSFSLGAANETPEWIRYLEMNLAAPFQPIETADYVLFNGAGFDPGFARLNRGSLEFPEKSATALICVTQLLDEPAESEAPVCSLVLAGPGVKGQTRLSAAGLDPGYITGRQRTIRYFPMGVDLFLLDGHGKVAGIPRTSMVEVG